MVETPSLEIAPPDMARLRGDGPVPYVHGLDAAGGMTGPHLLIVGGVHGNEPCGTLVIERLIDGGFRPARGRLTLAIGNPAAVAAFDRDHPGASRCVAEDLNRLWDESVLDAPDRSPDHRRARELRAVVDAADHVLDLHSTLTDGPAMTLAGTTARGLDLARRLDRPRDIVVDTGHAAGRRLRDYTPFATPNGTRTALLVECGQHWRRATFDTALAVTARFLAHFGMRPKGDTVLPDPAPATEEPVRLHRVTEAVVARSATFRFLGPYRGLERITTAGTVIAEDAGTPVATPYDDCFLVMPTPSVAPGQTAVRFARREALP